MVSDLSLSVLLAPGRSESDGQGVRDEPAVAGVDRLGGNWARDLRICDLLTPPTHNRLATPAYTPVRSVRLETCPTETKRMSLTRLNESEFRWRRAHHLPCLANTS